MQTDPAPEARRSKFNSVFVKLTALMAVGTAVVALALATLAVQTATQSAMEGLRGKAVLATDLLGNDAGGAIQFRKEEAVNVVLDRAMTIGDDTVAAIAISAEGEVLGQHAVEGQDTSGMVELGQRAVEQALAADADGTAGGQDMAASDDGLTVARASRFGKNNAVVGAVVTRWTPAPVLAEIQADNFRSYLVSGAIFIVTMIGAAFLLRGMLSMPLTRVNVAMREVAGGNYAVAVPSTGRGDEIGQVARSLEGFRSSLAEGEEALREGMFQGAAFMGSSASMMLLDKDFNIRSMNPALDHLMRDYRDAFASDVADFDPDALVGRNMDMFHAKRPHVRKVLTDPANLPFKGEVKLGDERFSIEVSQVADAAGEHLGYVAEWKCVTAEKRNAVLIGAIDANQLRAEISPDGRLVACNAGFAALFGADEAAMKGRPVGTALLRDGAGVLEDLVAGHAVAGRFTLARDRGGEAVLDGSASPVRDPSGRTVLSVFLATDVTEQSQAIAAAEARRKEMEAAQQRVVEALRVGLGRLAEGDLTTEITQTFGSEYEQLRVDFNEATRRLLQAMQAVIENADSIRSEAGEISSASDDLSRRTEQQAATLEETAAALDELTASVKSAAEVAAQANQMVAEAKTKAEKSGEVVREAVVAMGEIEESSGKISKITSVIDEIAFQTNLLALNAGVEAARAGEAGRGFAVVASEVRALAQRSSDAAREIAGLISASSSQVKRGVDLVGQAGEALTSIEGSVGDIYNFVSEIAVSAKEQSSGLAEINVAVNQLDQVTQQNAAMFEQTNAASHALTREAETLHSTMGRFKTGTAVAAVATGMRPASAPAAQPAAPVAAPAGFSSRRKGAVPPVQGATALAAQPTEDEWQEF